MDSRHPGSIPSRWLNCPRKAVSLLADKFLAFKTPLGRKFDGQVPEECRFPPKMLFMAMKSYRVKLGLWIDLTNTNRFYDKKEVEEEDCKYLKLQCRGHGETPSEDQTRLFIQLVSQFIINNPLEVIGIHCTHGFNRTGFLLVSYMVEKLDCSVDAAIREFAIVRPPGIYKADYLTELYRRYDDIEDAPAAPPLPDWCTEEEEPDEVEETITESSSGKPKLRRESNKTGKFMAGVPGVEPYTSQPRLSMIQKKVQDMCEWKSSGFPGCQPVSMSTDNIRKLNEKPYRVSWKADGTRYMMLIDGEREVYFFDRDHCAFRVENLRFPYRKDLRCHLKNTLIDGEMVIDKVDGKAIPRFLIYDIIKFENQDVGKMSFYPVRLKCIDNEIVGPRHQAMKEGRIDKAREPFSVRLKQFWDLSQASQLLGEKFARTLSHEPDGLIFQPSMEPYMSGRCDEVLKWKPLDMNSVDFRLKISTEAGEGILARKVGYLFVGKMDRPFAQMKYTKALKELNNKIIECKFENHQWIFMRERTDKSFPNGYDTAHAVCQSILDPVTKEKLLDYIEHHRFIDDADIMPPPKKVRR